MTDKVKVEEENFDLKASKSNETNETKPLLSYRMLKIFGILLSMWPIDKTTKKVYRIFYELLWWIFLINDIFLFLGVLIGLCHYYKYVSTFSTTICIILELMVISEKMYTSILFKVRQSQFKVLITVLENAVKNVESKEAILLKEMESSILTNVTHCIIYGLMFFLYIYLHLFDITLILPKEVWHPFPIDPYNKKILVLFQQMIYIFETGALNVADGLLFMTMNVASVKLKILAQQFESVHNKLQLNACIRKHQEILSYINEINSLTRFMIFKTIIATVFYIILGQLQLVHIKEAVNLPLICQFFGVIAIVNYRVYYTARCADTISTRSENLSFSLPWTGMSGGMASTICIIIQRCQKPSYISVSGIMPQFSLKYYAAFLSFTFSYFVTVRAILELKIGF